MTVSLLSVLTVIAIIWWVAIILTAILGEELFYALIAILTVATAGLLLYRFGEIIVFVGRGAI